MYSFGVYVGDKKAVKGQKHVKEVGGVLFYYDVNDVMKSKF